MFCNRFNYQAGRWITIYDLGYRPELVFTDISLEMTLPARGNSSNQKLYHKIYEMDARTFQVNTVIAVTIDCSHREHFGFGEIQFACSWECALSHLLLPAYWRKIPAIGRMCKGKTAPFRALSIHLCHSTSA